jgi:hypothetical protein
MFIIVYIMLCYVTSYYIVLYYILYYIVLYYIILYMHVSYSCVFNIVQPSNHLQPTGITYQNYEVNKRYPNPRTPLGLLFVITIMAILRESMAILHWLGQKYCN